MDVPMREPEEAGQSAFAEFVQQLTFFPVAVRDVKMATWGYVFLDGDAGVLWDWRYLHQALGMRGEPKE